MLTVAGESVTDLAAEFGTPTYVVDEDDFRRRARGFKDAFPSADVYYAGKAFLCVATARWIAEEGLNLDVCTGGELAVALKAEFPPARIGLHGNNKSVAELRRALEVGVGRIIIDSIEEIERLRDLTAELGVTAPVMIRVTAGVEAHTHEYISTSHEDQKFGFSIVGGDALDAVRRVLAEPGLELRGLHSHIGSQIFVTDGFEVAARRVLRLHAEIEKELGVALPEFDLGGGFGIAYTTQDDPSTPDGPRSRDAQDRRRRVRCDGHRRASSVDRARPRDRRPLDVHAVRGRHHQVRRARRRGIASLHLGRRRHERQHPARALRRRLLLHPGVA